MKTGTSVIAHRGASGYLPEHTREAKILAYGQGCDFLEQDVVATRDGQLVVLHDIFLDDITDVASKFFDRRRPDGHYYVVDFDLDEIRLLNVIERRRPGTSQPLRETRFDDESVTFRVVTLDEELRLIAELNRTTGRRVGIYPEIKRPDWHRQHGFDLSAALLDVLDAYGYREADDAVFVQCFDAEELVRCRDELGTRLKLVQLVEQKAAEDLLSASHLARIAEYADAAAPHYSQLIAWLGAPDQGTLQMSQAAREARALGLDVHPYTFRRDSLPRYANSLEQLLDFFVSEIEVAALFCDHPDVAVRVRDRCRE